MLDHHHLVKQARAEQTAEALRREIQELEADYNVQVDELDARRKMARADDLRAELAGLVKASRR